MDTDDTGRRRFISPVPGEMARLLMKCLWAGELKAPPLPAGYVPYRPTRWTRIRWWFQNHRPYMHLGSCDDGADPWD